MFSRITRLPFGLENYRARDVLELDGLYRLRDARLVVGLDMNWTASAGGLANASPPVCGSIIWSKDGRDSK